MILCRMSTTRKYRPVSTASSGVLRHGILETISLTSSRRPRRKLRITAGFALRSRPVVLKVAHTLKTACSWLR